MFVFPAGCVSSRSDGWRSLARPSPHQGRTSESGQRVDGIDERQRRPGLHAVLLLKVRSPPQTVQRRFAAVDFTAGLQIQAKITVGFFWVSYLLSLIL